MKRFSNKVIYTSFIMSIFVMYIHGINISYYNFPCGAESTMLNCVIRLFADTIGKIAVPYFFIMSAYWLFRPRVVPDKKNVYFQKKLQKKVKTLLLPYLCWNTVGMVFYIAITRIPLISSMMNNQEVVEITVESVIKGIFLHANYYSFCYMADLIMLTLASPFINYMLQRKKVSVVVVFILSVFAYFDVNFLIFKAESLFYFVLGGCITVYFNDFWSEENKNKWLYLLAFIVFVGLRYFDIPVAGRVAYLVLPILMWKAMDVILPEKLIEHNPSWFITQTFFIYAAHLIPITCLGHLLSKLNGGIVWATISYCAAPGITLIFLFIAAVWMHRFMPKIYSVLCGARS